MHVIILELGRSHVSTDLVINGLDLCMHGVTFVLRLGHSFHVRVQLPLGAIEPVFPFCLLAMIPFEVSLCSIQPVFEGR